MDGDIDIEEHDLLENPDLKRIFPDLSLLKKEIECNDGNPETHSVCSSRNETITKSKQMFKNKIIIGSKKSEIIMGKGVNKKNKNAKIILKNIKFDLIRSKKFCQRCLILFPERADFINHQQLFHSKRTQNNYFDERNDNIIKNGVCDEELKQNTLPERSLSKNVMVHINEEQNETIKCNSIKPCFHCKVLFPTQQSLIDHIYEILYIKKSQNEIYLPKSIEYVPMFTNINDVSKDITPEKSTDTSKTKELAHLYMCPICSYYFDVKKFFLGHLSKKHRHNIKTPPKVVEFNPLCKFCQLNFLDVSTYNTHLRKTHRHEMTKKDTELSKTFVANKDQNKSFKHNITYNLKSGNSNVQNKEDKLGSAPSEVVKDPKIEEADPIVKILSEAYVMASKVFLYKCVECNIHFLTSNAATSHKSHLNNLKTSKCRVCQKLFKQEDLNLHKKQHLYSKYFTVEVVKNCNLQKKKLYKCPTCAIHFNNKNFTEHVSVCETIQAKSAYCRICDILIDDNMEVSHVHCHKLRNNNAYDFQIIENINKKQKIKNTKNLCNDVINKNKKRFQQFYCCDVCKCSIPKSCTKAHMNFDCKYNAKHVCEFCGLLFSNKYINAHRRMHQKLKLKLYHFTFYDLKTKIKMCPLSEFPKCKTCEKHFIYEYEVQNHQCNDKNFMICTKCKTKFSYTAYVIHEPFHKYITNVKRKANVKKKCISKSVKSDSRNPIVTIDLSNIDETQFSYLCKNCDIAFNEYDDIIEHCHSHVNLNKIEIASTKCTICDLKFVATTYQQHEIFHKKREKVQFQCLSFDVLYFGLNNREWLHHIFGALPKYSVNKSLQNAIYKYENRIKMTIIQNGLPELTLYKCDGCQIIVDCNFIYQHIQNCHKNSNKYDCKSCNMWFLNKVQLHEHNKYYHYDSNTQIKFRVVTFNRQDDKQINYSIATMQKYYVMHECRFCHVIVNKDTYKYHKCFTSNCQSCFKCGLLLHDKDYELHVLKHVQVNSFNKKTMKVVLIGNKTKETNTEINKNQISKFSGIVCDYKLYQCVQCDVCVRDLRSVSDHYCLIDSARFKCPVCEFVFDEGKLKSHLKLHETDPDFTKDTVMVEIFGDGKFTKYKEPAKYIDKNGVDIISKDYAESNVNDNQETCVKIYRCQCDLHFIDPVDILGHIKKCSAKAKIKQGVQNCFKCGLTFTPSGLFKHLLKHHSAKKRDFKYDIIENITLEEVDPRM